MLDMLVYDMSYHTCIQHVYSYSRLSKPGFFVGEKHRKPPLRPDAKRSLMKTKNFSLVI